MQRSRCGSGHPAVAEAMAGAMAAIRPGLIPLAGFGLALAVFLGTVLGWIWRHPEIGGWDQIGYADELQRDLLARAQGGWGALRDSLFLEARHHPPGARLLGLPLGLLQGRADLTTLRLLACAMSLLTALLVGLTARRAAGPGGGTAAGLLAASAFLLAPATLFAAEEFLSEALLLPALAGLLWCLAREVTGEAGWGTAALLGLCLGAGALARLSFVPQVAPVLVLGLGLVAWRDPARLGRLALAGMLAALVATPHYALNAGRYIGYARFALADWHSHELKADSWLGYPGNWLAFVADWAFGPFVAVAFVLGLAALGLAALAWRGRPAQPALGIALVALLLAAPPVAGHLLASNHNPRFLLAAMPGLAVAMAIGLQGCRLLPLGFGLVAAQAVALGLVWFWPAPPPLAGLSAMQSRPGLACDWRAVAGLVGGPRGRPEGGPGGSVGPRLLLLGQADGFNEVQVSYAFHRQGQLVEVAPLTSRAAWPLLAREAGQAEGVLALVGADPRDIPHYRQNFRRAPGQVEERLDLVPEPLLARLQAEAGFTRRQEIAAPGGGACRAVLLGR